MKIMTVALAALTMFVSAAWGDDKLPLTLQLKWFGHASSAGYLVAQEKGFYDEEGLGVTIQPGGTDISPVQVLASGRADVIIEWMPAALLAREHGLPIINIAQPFTGSSLTLSCLRESGITNPATDFRGKTLATWFGGNELVLLSWLNRLGLSTEGGADGVTVLKQETGATHLLQKQADCISILSYDQDGRLLDGGLSADDLTSFRYADQGLAPLEDGLYILETTMLERPKVTALVRFVRASMKGWDYAANHPDEAADILLRHEEADAQKLSDQARMVTEAARLITDPTARLEEADFQRTVDMLSEGPAPILNRAPEGAWISTITDRAFD